MMITGLIVGWRIHSSPLEALAAVGILLLFAYAFSWAMAWIGLLVRSPEVFNNASFIFIFPITYIANTFVAVGEPAGGPAARRRVEPGLGRHAGRPRTVRQHLSPADRRRTCGRCSTRCSHRSAGWWSSC